MTRENYFINIKTSKKHWIEYQSGMDPQRGGAHLHQRGEHSSLKPIKGSSLRHVHCPTETPNLPQSSTAPLNPPQELSAGSIPHCNHLHILI